MRERLKKILEYIDGVCPSGVSCYNCQYKDVGEGCSMLAKADYLIANNVVPVVRCKDCKHYEDHKRKIYENCVRDGRVTPMKPDDFCSRGERREGE